MDHTFKHIKSLSFDAKPKNFKMSSAAEREFYKQLKKVAEESAKVVRKHTKGASIIDEPGMIKALRKYSESLTPWAMRQSEKLLKQVSNSNKRSYRNKSETMSYLLKTNFSEIQSTEAALALMNEQVALIKSIPLEAGLRAQNIAQKNILEGRRAQPDPSVVDQLKKEMGMTEEVAVNKAKLIARTETARANSAFVESRAASVGSEGYIWKSAKSPNSRKSHVQMHNKFVRWDTPPTLSDGTTGHAGTFPNCLCYPDPVLPDYD